MIIDADVSMSFLLHPVMKRNVGQMVALNSAGAHLIDPLFDAVCTAIHADGLVFRGWESGASGREQMQEWFVRPAGKATDVHRAPNDKPTGPADAAMAQSDPHLLELGLVAADGSLTDLGRRVGERLLRDRKPL